MIENTFNIGDRVWVTADTYIGPATIVEPSLTTILAEDIAASICDEMILDDLLMMVGETESEKTKRKGKPIKTKKEINGFYVDTPIGTHLCVTLDCIEELSV